MGLEIFLIDFENVQPTGVGRLVPGTCRIMLFLGQNQNKVPVELTRDAGQEGDRNEDRDQDQGDGDHGARDLLHGLDRGIPRTQSLFDVVFHGLHDNNGVVHHDANRQHQSEQRQNVHREAQHGEEQKGADQRYRHGDEWNQCSAPALQEEKDHQDDQHHSLQQGMQERVDYKTSLASLEALMAEVPA